MAESTLILRGTATLVIRMALLVYRGELAKAKKKNEMVGVEFDSIDEHDDVAVDLLEQLGWKPKEKERSSAEVVDDAQIALPLNGEPAPAGDGEPTPLVRIECPACLREGLVAKGSGPRECPTCHQTYRVWCDDEDTVLRVVHLIRPPDAIIELMKREQDEDGKPLDDAEKKTLFEWVQDNPNHIVTPEPPAPPTSEGDDPKPPAE